MLEDYKSSLILGSICYHLAENLMFSNLLSKDVDLAVPLLHTCLDFYGYKFQCVRFKKEYRFKPIPDRATAAPRLLESRVVIPLRAWMFRLLCLLLLF